jgi:hypothetical protein
MTENTGGTPMVESRPDDFEKRLLTMLDSGEIHFPKGAVRPAAEEPPRTRAWFWLRRLKPRLPRLLLTAALAYAIALVVSAPVYLALLSRVPAPAPAATVPAASLPAVGSARWLDLGAGPTRAMGAGGDLTLAPNDAYLVLSFLVPVREGAVATYAATLEDGAGRVVVGPQPVRSVDELGNFVLVCRGDLFTPGEYRLTIQEGSRIGGAPSPPHRFSFQVSRQRR